MQGIYSGYLYFCIMRLALLTIFYCCFVSSALQSQTFKAALVGGINLSQIDGDDMAGYDKMGWNAGVKAYAFVQEQVSVSFEILYSEKGSRASLIDRQFVPPTTIFMQYAEIPILVHYHDRNGMVFGAGVAYNQLFDFRREVNGVDTSTDDPVPQTNDWAIMGDLTFMIKEHFGINGRMSYSLFSIAKDPSSNLQNQQWLNNVLSLRLLYRF